MDSTRAEQLNRDCYCSSADIPALQRWLAEDLVQRGLQESIVSTHPHLFSAAPVFVSLAHVARMRRLVRAVEAVVEHPAYRQIVLADAPTIARSAPAPRGGLLSFDFHISTTGPRLIEINTNAGGAMLNAALARAQRACCPEVEELLSQRAEEPALERKLFEVFVHEWARAGANAPLRRIAIVDDTPELQYLYPEFLLFAKLFHSYGVECIITDPTALVYTARTLLHAGRPIDLVYNRLTDFYLEAPTHTLLRQAYAENAAILTPHPHAFALYANKRNLTLLSDEQSLRKIGINGEVIATLLEGIPRTVKLDARDAEQWWADRKQWFFKPAAGFGSRGSYRGDKLTRKVFQDILQGQYVAQTVVTASERWIDAEPAPRALKIDLRCYVYDGEILALAGRLYQGQTTNMRTPGGGFAPVYVIPDRA